MRNCSLKPYKFKQFIANINMKKLAILIGSDLDGAFKVGIS